MMPTVLRATNELVAAGWLAGLPELDANMVGPSLPNDNTTWAASGFVQVTTVGGGPNIYVKVRKPVVQVDCWAVSPSSNKAPWGKANYLAEVIRSGADDHPSVPRDVVLPGNYPTARVLTAYLLTEPRKVLGDSSSYARYQFDLQMDWVEL
ncbi:hypothetical protein ACFQH9_02130 [Pseudonocardia lutea]|uniref:Minor tail protein n=1 Tax=Pseudonocardia lutea TaxID=2172015 RepID=A0ABW1I1K5_9PSEU